MLMNDCTFATYRVDRPEPSDICLADRRTACEHLRMDEEVRLEGGNVSGVVVCVGQTVRKQAGSTTRSVDHLLGYLARCGFDAAPRSFGRDAEGRQSLEFVPGEMAHDVGLLDLEGLARVGGLVRRLHDLTAAYEPPSWARWNVPLHPDREALICHNDLAPWNLVAGERWVLIDWDNAGPSYREWELAYAAHGFAGMADGNEPVQDAARLAALVDGYGLERAGRQRLCRVLHRPARAMQELLTRGAASGTQPWAQLAGDGHADHWGGAATYIERNVHAWEACLL